MIAVALSKVRELQRTYLAKGSLKERFVVGALWSLAGAVISRGLTLIASIVSARLLGTSGFGEFGIIQSTVGMLGAFAGLGLGMTATKYIAEYRHRDPIKAGNIIGMSLAVAGLGGGLLSLFLYLFAARLAAGTLAAPQLTPLLRIGVVLLFFSTLSGVQTGILAGFEAFRRIARVGLVAGLLSFPLLIGGILMAGLQGAVWALGASMTVNCLFNHLALRDLLREHSLVVGWTQGWKERTVLWKFSLPAFLSGSMVGPISWLCGAILVNQPNGYAEMGIFNAANQWRNAILFLPASIGAMALPMLAGLQSADDNGRYNKVLWSQALLNMGIAIAAAIITSAASALIMGSYGKEFMSGTGTLVALSAAAVLSAGATVIGQAIASRGRMWWGFILNAIWGGVLIIACLLLADRGAFGLAIANVIAYGTHLVLVGAFTIFVLQRQR